jgi:hypothetical protein
MYRYPLLASLLLALPFLGLPAPAAAGLRCSGGLVRSGDRMFEVRQACGEPDVSVVLHSTYTVRRGYVPDRHEWQYNFGPHRLTRFLRFQNGRLTHVRTGPYGFHSLDGNCRPNDLDRGLSLLELLARCGQPMTVETRVTNRRYEVSPGGTVFPIGIPAEDWIYDFGGNHFIRIATVINGRVVKVERSSSRGGESQGNPN